MCESAAILRHVGRRYSLYGSTPVQAAHVDEAIEGCTNLARAFIATDPQAGGGQAEEGGGG